MKKKGFTLIELLAVIVILAIIALITVPVVIKIINNSKKGAAEDSTYGIIESAKLFWASKQYDFGSNYSLVEFECDGTKVCSAKTPASFSGDLDISGTKPTGGIIRIQNGEVEVEDLEFGEYLCNTDSNYKVICEVSTTPRNVKITFDSNGGSSVDQVEIEKGSTISSLPTSTKEGFNLVGWFTDIEAGEELTTSTKIKGNITYYAHWQKTYTLGQLVYYDPVSTAKCDSSTFNLDNVKNGTSTCYKWRVISTNTTGSNLNIQLDHNLVNKVKWNDSPTSDNSKGPNIALSSLAGATSTWSRVNNLTYTYDISTSVGTKTLSCTNGTCTMPSGTVNNVKARLITVEELNEIVKTVAAPGTIPYTWSHSSQDRYYFSKSDYILGTNSSGKGNTTLSWLLENIQVYNSSGSTANVYDSSNYSYWMLSPRFSNNFSAWYVNYMGYLDDYSVNNAYCGVRPVIVVPKSDLN